MLEAIEGYQLVKPQMRLSSLKDCLVGPQIQIPGLGYVNISANRAKGYEPTDRGVMFTSKGELITSPASHLIERGFLIL